MKQFPIVVLFLLHQVLISQIQDGVDFTHGKIHIAFDLVSKTISGKVLYDFNVLKDVDSLFWDAKNMDIETLLLDRVATRYESTSRHLILNKKFKKGTSHSVQIQYRCQPKQTVYFIGWENDNRFQNQIWTQGQGKYTSHWLPSFDDMNEKVEFDLNINFESGYYVVANGKLLEKKMEGDTTIWRYDMQRPMSSYLLAFAIGMFEKKEEISSSGIPIELYYEPQDSAKFEPTFRYTKRIFDFFENEIGVPYPWQNYKQVPVQDFLYAGMENTGTTFFSNSFMIDSIAFVDKNYVNVNAHELAHQWFGNLVTEQSGEHHWLHEGFATYYAYLAEKEIFGDDYFYWKLWETASALAKFSEAGNGEALTNPNAGSLTFYEKGAWALIMLKERVGDLVFKEGIRNYLEKYAFKNVTLSDFLWEMRKASGMKLLDFEETWLQNSEFPLKSAQAFLRKKSPSLTLFFDLEDEFDRIQSDDVDFQKYWYANSSTVFFKRELVRRHWRILPRMLLAEVLDGESLELRREFVASVENINSYPIEPVESLLEDRSYVTNENALAALWMTYPENRKRYLTKTNGILGLPNKNVRLLWLVLALSTDGYTDSEKSGFYAELSGYTHPKYHFEVRLLAFQYLKNLGALSDDCLKNLIKACNHHVWYFKKSCRKILKEFLKGDGNPERLKSIYTSLNQKEREYVDKTLGK
ncbi:MAG: M1 family metallopeptidase [Bacteroidota bacterium]